MGRIRGWNLVEAIFQGGRGGREGGDLSLSLSLSGFFCLLVHSILARGEEGGGKERERAPLLRFLLIELKFFERSSTSLYANVHPGIME